MVIASHLQFDKNEDKVKIKVEEVDEEEDEEEEIPAILEETEILHRLREYNELITWMDSEFQNQSQDLFHKKLERMQHEMLDIQQGSHPAYLDEVSDLKLKREKTIFSAECFMAYQLEFAEGQHAQSMNTIQDEFEMERRHLHTTLMTIIDDRRKQIKEDKLEDKSFNIEVPVDVFQDAHSRISHRRNLRNNKKPQGDKLHGLSSRHEPTRRRQARVVTLHNIHAQPFSKEEEELKADFISMKIR
ncbi:hypothetical protein PHYBLDRAFT_66876 [Phycomyces blakesleeanus NRRL 1555(-)]|uniref:Uncharacterized protein n=1 Tax=Phycomyces blakesleeanus (strain ATCC 8743b / DSM 1359 / FGSC 10004 / NBRC 33097 / NRRL 1555) TaxID=763407 RepID=A0A162TJT6_PHYB8|nr:hypothetical protein PHYBLDRAFT_66876 [Phycomyces blakesleeanus NRRL 1555(-)]OAD69152.1 hypothetical protein PHYBLDRAFT_66876 [Phycomyces blakesleeanus NRRL 1555(-)]|eukprot:XP_018287192.1 hypothetical protein PHYBLDRAFT_66876 [Phycomyces blakesleeanus NRRL 1555(-)]